MDLFTQDYLLNFDTISHMTPSGFKLSGGSMIFRTICE